ncbi:MAG: HEAT repeat domain-containing protein [Polyangiaceae bacterium]|nr:HEAT repeat domain-containing protein [Polyangiaceae bacterium]
MAPALKDLGQALVRQRKNQEAIEVLRRALQVAGQGAGVRREIHTIITEAYRAEGRLPELISVLESTRSNDFDEIVTLGLLLEETGQVEKALDAYRRAVRVNSRHIDTHLKIIHILQAQGDLTQAIREYEALIRAVPGNPSFSFELCEILIQNGDRVKALAVLTRLEQQIRDDDQLGRLADFYERIDENARAMRLLQRLSNSGSRDPRYIIDLGDRYYQQGDKKKAVETWARLRTMIPSRAEALMTLGEVYLDHDMGAEALEALKEAVQLEPQNTKYLKSYAVALERTGVGSVQRGTHSASYSEALTIWDKILTISQSTGNESQAREARMHIVTLWVLTNNLSAQVAPLSAKFNANPPDISSGRMLSEVQIRLRRHSDAETTLARLIELRPGEAELYLSLERVFVLQRKLDDAIRILDKLTTADPKRARQYYQRMAQYSAELYRDDDAVGYAAQAVALDPDDAEGHRRLGDMYRRRQDTDRAISEYLAAIAKNDRLFSAYFDLAELLLARGDADQADSLLRRVIRSCPDEEMVGRAARLSMQVNLGKNTLEILERDLLPIALGNPQKKVYGRLLVDVYGAMTFPLVQKVKYGTPAQASSAREQLSKIGSRAVKPLLDALANENLSQQRIAIEVLAFVQNRSAAPSLFAFATGQAESELRVRAMLACGAIRDPGMLPRYEGLLSPKASQTMVQGGPITLAAAWGVARLQTPSARTLLRHLVSTGTPEVRAIAILGLGFGKDQQSIGLISQVIQSPDAGNITKAAAALALAELGAKSEAKTLLVLAGSQESLPREAMLVALARLDPERATPLISDSLFDTNPSLRKAAHSASLVLGTGQFKRAVDPWEVPDGSLSVREVLGRVYPSGYSVADNAKTLVVLENQVTAAAVRAVRGSPGGARLVADSILSRGKEPAVAPFTDGLEELGLELRRDAESAALRVFRETEPGFIALIRHPSTDLRVRAVSVLSRSSSSQAQAAIIDALYDDHETVQRSALAVLGEGGSELGVDALCRTLLESSAWSVRVRAAQALGHFGQGRAPSSAVAALSKAAREDSYALVREAAVVSLSRVARVEARGVLVDVSNSDEEGSIRSLARGSLVNDNAEMTN